MEGIRLANIYPQAQLIVSGGGYEKVTNSALMLEDHAKGPDSRGTDRYRFLALNSLLEISIACSRTFLCLLELYPYL